MAEKCSFSEKFRVWALACYINAGGDPTKPYDPIIATKAFTDVFNNVDQAVEEFGKMMPGAENGSASGSSYSGVIDIDLDNANLTSYYTGGVGFMQMQSKFRRKMLAATVFSLDPQTGEYEFVDGYGVDENNINIAQKKILEYKAELINSLRASINKAEFPEIDIKDLYDIESYTTIVNETINAFSDYMSSTDKNALMQTDVYDNFVILKNFDKLIKGYASYIDIDESFEKAGKEGLTKYSFTPKVKHYTGFSTDEGADVLKQVSNLAETILAVACDIDVDNKPLNSISVSGFNGAMGTLKEALLYSSKMLTKEDARAYRRTYSKGAGALLDEKNPYNLLNFIDAFIDTYKSNSKSVGDFESYRQIYLHNKLRGIKKYLLDRKTPAYIKNMFIQMFLKSEPTSYRVYSYNRDLNEFRGDNLRSRMQVTQKFAFENVIKGGITLLNSDSRAFSKALTDKYKFKFSKSGQYEKLIISNGNRELTLKYKVDDLGAHLLSTAKEDVKLIQEGDETLIKDIMRDAYSYIVPDSYKTCIAGPSNFNENEDFAPFVAIAAQEALKNMGIQDKGTNFGIINPREQVDLSKFNAKLLEIGQRLGVIFGNSIKSTIKSLSGSTLPLFNLTSMEYNWRSCLDVALEMDEVLYKDGITQINPWTNSFIGLNEDFLTGPQIRSDIECNGQIKSPTKLSLNELNKLSMIDDFFVPLATNSGKDDDALYLQHATFSDKARHFVMGYRLNKLFNETFSEKFIEPIWTNQEDAPKTLGEMLKKAMKSKEDRENLSQFVRETRVRRYSAVAYNILGKYKKAFPKIGIGDIDSAIGKYDLKFLVEELNKVDEYLLNSKLSINDVKKAFRDNRLDFINETDAYEPAMKGIGSVRINETMLSLMTATSTKENWDKRNSKNLRKFAEIIAPIHLNSFDRESKQQVALLLDEKKERNLFDDTQGFYNPDTREYKFVDGDRLHPLAEVYFYANMLLSGELNGVTLGEIWAHPNKNKTDAEIIGKDINGNDIVEYGHYLEFSEASRLVNQVKRSVINGSTIHPFAQGIKDNNGNYCGVTDQIEIAVINDNKGLVFTPLGVDDTVDSQDGSGWYTALQAVLENNSLVDAAAGENKKTILHDIDPLTGTPVLLKWAVYSLSNMVRRNGFGSNANVESLVRRAYSKSLSLDQIKSLQLDEIYKNYLKKNKPIFIKDQLTLQYKELERIEKVSDYEYRRVYTNAEPEIINIATASQKIINNQPQVTLYGIDQLFGGAFTYKKVDNHYEGTEASVDLLAATAIEYDLRDKQIAYLVNKSAMKVGHRNINDKKAWTEDIPLDTFKIHTRFGGLMMDADHDLDHAEVTEMSQMISALIEDGHYPEKVEAIYKSIGEIALNNDRVKKYIEAVNNNDRDKLREIVGKSLISTFESGNKDTIGLANAFVRKASKELAENTNIDTRTISIPFSDGTIFGAVMADVTSALSKAGIRRKHPGLASVLNPSHDMAMYYNIGGKNMLWDQANEECKTIFEQRGFAIEGGILSYNGSKIKAIDINNNPISFTSWQELARKAVKFINQIDNTVVDDLKNPFWDLISSKNVDFEDTLIIKHPDGNIEEVYVNNRIIYDRIRNLGAYDECDIYRHNAAARNLRGTDTIFTVKKVSTGEIVGTYSYYNIDSVRAAGYINELKIDPSKISSLINSFVEANKDNWINVELEDKIYFWKLKLIEKVVNQLIEQNLPLTVEGCNVLTQNFLEQLDLGKQYAEKQLIGDIITEDDTRAFLKNQDCFGIELQDGEHLIASSYTVRPAEIMLGRYQMQKLGLDKSDHIYKIKEKGYQYFKDKLKNTYEIPSLIGDKDLSMLYDKVIYHNGKPFLVKIEKGKPDYSNAGITITDAPEANIVGDDLRWESNVIISGENKDKYHFSKVSDGQKEYTLITINEDVSNYELGETPLFDELLASEYFDDFYRNYENDSNKTWITDDYEYYGSEEARVDHMFETLAKNRYDAFIRGIQFIGARIPTQAMQSFMPFEVICFLDDDQNKAYVPKANTHIEGSDYDIDKLYLLAMTILNGGKLASGSNLQSIVGYNVASKLEVASSTFSETTTNPTRNIVKDSLLKELTEPLDEITSQKFISFVNRAIRNGDYELRFENTHTVMSTGEFNRRKKQLLKLLNKHANTPTRVLLSDEVLKSKVFSGIYDIVLSAQNQLKAQITVDTCTGDLKDTAAKTVSGNAEKKVSPDIPSSMFVMQEQNQLGKSVVGIGAVSLKTYFILSTANNIKASKVADLINHGNYYNAYELFTTMEITNPINGGITTIANTNLNIIERALNKINPEENTALADLKKTWLGELQQMKQNTSYISTPEFLSGIISLAADNAKDLALPKLNATEDLVDLYTTATMIGIPFLGTMDGDKKVTGISEIMTSPIFNWLTKMSEDNIFNSYSKGRKTKDMIKVALRRSFKIFPNNTEGLKKLVHDYNTYVDRHNAEVEKNGGTFWEHIVGEDDKGRWTGEFLTDKKDIERVKEWVKTQIKASDDIAAIKAENKALANGEIDTNDIVDALDVENEQPQAIIRWTESHWYKVYKALEFYESLLDQLSPIQTSTKTGSTLESSGQISPELGLLNSLSTLLSLVKEMSTLGAQGGINQGLKTNMRDFYNFKYKVEDIINEELSLKNKKDTFKNFLGSLNNINPLFVEELLKLSEEPFSMTKFLWDKDYADKMCIIMRHFKSGFNILDSLRYSPHFFAMSKLVPIADYTMKSVSVMYDTATEIADTLTKGSPNTEEETVFNLSQNDFDAIEDYINDLMIFEFLKQKDITLDLNAIIEETGANISTYETSKATNTTSRRSLKLDNALSIASAKHIIESVIIPYLKTTEPFKNNKFVQDLNASADKNGTIVFALPIQMMEADKDETTRNLYMEYLTGFNELSRYSIGGMNLGDIFFLYNLITNKNSFGQKALTRIFEDLIDSKSTPEIISKYYNFIGELDKKTANLDIRMDEVRYRIAKYSKGTKVTSEKRLELSGDFTLDLPFTADINEEVLMSTKSGLIDYKPISSMTSDEVLRVLANKINTNRVNPLVKIVDNEDEVVQSLKFRERGFIKDGVIYLNTSTFEKQGATEALSVGLHEIAHLILAGIKAQKPESVTRQKFYQMFLRVLNDKELMKKWEAIYPNRVGSDLAEEILCNEMETLLTDRISKDDQYQLQLVEDKILFSGIKELFSGVEDLSDVMGVSLQTIVENFTKDLFVLSDDISSQYIKGSQQLAAIKAYLFRQGEKLENNQKADNENNLRQECKF